MGVEARKSDGGASSSSHQKWHPNSKAWLLLSSFEESSRRVEEGKQMMRLILNDWQIQILEWIAWPKFYLFSPCSFEISLCV